MSHIYQPVMLLDLLKGGGTRSIQDIAKSILRPEPAPDYEKIIRDMVGRVLRNRGCHYQGR